MAYANNSDTLRQHRDKLLGIALAHAQRSGLGNLKRAEIASEAGVSIGVVSFALGNRAELIDKVMKESQRRGIQLSYA